MKDFSMALPSWAIRAGYRLEGGQGTYDNLYLYRDFDVVEVWDCFRRIPTIFELEDFINEIEDKEVK